MDENSCMQDFRIDGGDTVAVAILPTNASSCISRIGWTADVRGFDHENTINRFADGHRIVYLVGMGGVMHTTKVIFWRGPSTILLPFREQLRVTAIRAKQRRSRWWMRKDGANVDGSSWGEALVWMMGDDDGWGGGDTVSKTLPETDSTHDDGRRRNA